MADTAEQPTAEGTGIICPGCHAFLPAGAQIGDHGRIACVGCGWRGEVYFYDPVPFSVEQAETALPEDATCINHPSKKAVDVCAGTGDYICSLCAVEIAGQTFSANYVNQHGQKALAKHFQRKMSRPDRVLRFLMVAGIILSCALVGPIFIIASPFLWWKMMKLRKTDQLYRQVISGFDLGLTLVVVILAVALVALICGLMIVGFMVG